MIQSTYLGRYFQIDTYIHWTFKLILGWMFLSSMFFHGLGYAIASTTLMLVAFACIYLHELGHALTARRYGIRTLDITMLPIGGVARLEKMPDEPLAEFWIAVAGPAVNVVIALLIGAWLTLTGVPDTSLNQPADILQQEFLLQLLVINIGFVLFNLLPAFPMDGGRVLRSLLQLRTNRLEATRIAARVSRYFAFAMIVVGIFFSWTLPIIGIFVLIGSSQELLAANMEMLQRQERTGAWDDGSNGSPYSPFGSPSFDPSSTGSPHQPFYQTYTWSFQSGASKSGASGHTSSGHHGRQPDRDDNTLDATDVRRIE